MNNKVQFRYYYPLEKATKHSAGYDIRSVMTFIMDPGGIYHFDTGLYNHYFESFSGDAYALILPKSGLSSKGITLVNSPGLIDGDYEGEWRIMLRNDSSGQFEIKHGQKIAQALFFNVPSDFGRCNAFIYNQSERGEGGFGSTGM